ncbi:MAG: hypothetical protein U0572_18680 [Phycisphaerales bacterium]
MLWKRKRSTDHDDVRRSAAGAPCPPDDAFRRLLSEVREDTSPHAREAYFRAFWDLVWASETWYFLIDPSAPSRGPTPRPIAIEADGIRTTPFFTSVERAAVAARSLAATHGGVAPSTTGVPRDHACNLLCASTDSDAVLANPDDPAFDARVALRDLAAEYEQRFGRLTPRMFGRFAEAVNRGGARLRSRLIRRLLDAPEWWFVATEARRQAPSLIWTDAGSLVIPLFTDAERARRGGERLVAPLNEGQPIAIPMSLADGVSYLRRLHERNRHDAVAVLVNDVPDEPGEPAPLPIVEIIAAAEEAGY